ncbi:MAG: hypothetical protein H6Q68_3676 [Firmicutes bacterium]|nr:hypothetical protein [Bacillota bacterium]
MCVRVENAKYNTNRYIILSATALDVLRKYFRAYFTISSADQGRAEYHEL